MNHEEIFQIVHFGILTLFVANVQINPGDIFVTLFFSTICGYTRCGNMDQVAQVLKHALKQLCNVAKSKMLFPTETYI